MKKLPSLLVRLKTIKHDAALKPGKRGARKILVTKLYPAKEVKAKQVAWKPPAGSKKCPVQVTDNIEVAVFTQHASQDRHWHQIGTEMYTVLEGEMKIEVDGQDFILQTGDMIVVNPGAIHEVKPEGTEFICQVVTANCAGSADKYLE